MIVDRDLMHLTRESAAKEKFIGADGLVTSRANVSQSLNGGLYDIPGADDIMVSMAPGV